MTWTDPAAIAGLVVVEHHFSQMVLVFGLFYHIFRNMHEFFNEAIGLAHERADEDLGDAVVFASSGEGVGDELPAVVRLKFFGIAKNSEGPPKVVLDFARCLAF